MEDSSIGFYCEKDWMFGQSLLNVAVATLSDEWTRLLSEGLHPSSRESGWILHGFAGNLGTGVMPFFMNDKESSVFWEMLKSGVDVLDRTGKTPLGYASLQPMMNPKLISFLIYSGASLKYLPGQSESSFENLVSAKQFGEIFVNLRKVLLDDKLCNWLSKDTSWHLKSDGTSILWKMIDEMKERGQSAFILNDHVDAFFDLCALGVDPAKGDSRGVPLTALKNLSSRCTPGAASTVAKGISAVEKNKLFERTEGMSAPQRRPAV